MTRGSIHYVASGQLADAAYPPDGWWLDFPGMGRYSSTPTGNDKNIKPWEVDRADDLDHGLMWFAEQSELTPINNTTDDDRRLADQSAQMAESFGLPPGGPHMFAVDTDGRRYMDQVRAAFVTYRQRVPEKWPLWAYAGSDVIDQLVADGTIVGGHIPAALSWSSTTRPVDNVEVFQTPGGLRWYRTPNAFMIQHPSEAYRGGRIDRNTILPGKKVPLWYPGRQAPPQPSGDDMPGAIIDLRDSWVVFEVISWNAGRAPLIRWIDGPTRDDRLRPADQGGAGFERIERSWTELRNMTYIGAVLPQGDGHPAAPSINWDGSQFRDYVINGPAAPVDIAAITAAVTANIIANLQGG